MRTLFLAVVLAGAGLYACGGDTSSESAGGGGGPGSGDTDSGTSDPGSDDGGTTSPHDSGSSGGGQDAGTSHDAGTHADAGGVLDAGADAGNLCLNAVTPNPNGHHHPGQDCMGCHDGLSANRRWTIAGTLYSAATGGTAVSGATIEITDAKGQVVRLPTASDGNFYTLTAVTYPLKVRATKCPSDNHMVATLKAGTDAASCNQSGCHDSTMRIHVP